MDNSIREIQAQSRYEEGIKRVKETPEPAGQKFKCGQRVKIADDLGEYMDHFKSGIEAVVDHTYAHAFGGDDVKRYSLMFDDGSSSAWYEEHQLTAVR